MTPLTEAEVKNLVLQGYCRTSLRHGLVSRIDRPDWKERMAKQHAPWSHEEGLTWVRNMGSGAEDQYRRMYSRDTLEVGKAVNQFPPSGGTVTGYRAKEAL